MSTSPARYTSELARELAADAVERFVRYARIDTQSIRDRSGSPSTPGQLELGRMLVAECAAAGLAGARIDENGYVTASLAASDAGPQPPVIGLIAHLDTSPDAPGRGVEPIIHRAYDGGVIELPRAGTKLDPASMPELAARAGHDIITASGDTLLGADDKAGVAEIMAAVAHLAAHPELPRPELRVAFTPDEEIGEGATLFDIPAFGALCAYTLDGSGAGAIEDETFSAREAVITVDGVDVHPGMATGKLVNALRIVAQIVAALPADRLTPETTSGREGFIHPYELSGTAARASVRLILRDFDDALLDEHVALLERAVRQVASAAPRATVELAVREQYRNMRTYLDAMPEAVAIAERAIRAEGLDPVRQPIRGGTDGSRLSEMGLPTPNLFTGGAEYHSAREFASVQDMGSAAATIVRLAGEWAARGRAG